MGGEASTARQYEGQGLAGEFVEGAHDKVQNFEAAFHEAFQGDQDFLNGVVNIVGQLEGSGKSKDDFAKRRPETVKQAEKMKRREADINAAASGKADEEALAWLMGPASTSKPKFMGGGSSSSKGDKSKPTSAPVMLAAEEAGELDLNILPPPPPKVKPMVIDWDTPALRAFLEDDKIIECWEDEKKGPLLREFLDRMKQDPAKPHGIHPDLKDLFADPGVKDKHQRMKKDKVGAAAEGGDAKKKKGPKPKYYELLDVEVDATYDEIKKAFRKQALKYHPDKHGNSKEATDRFQEINLAFDTLFDPERREKYDAGDAMLSAKPKKLQGAGWKDVADEDENVLAKEGLRARMKSWAEYYNGGGRIDDDENDLVTDKDDPRYPAIRIKLLWRKIGELAYEAREEWDEGTWKNHPWMQEFLEMIWKDTPARWPKPAELKKMNAAGQGEWKDRRMVFNRRKHKVLLHLSLYEEYLDTPFLREKEEARFKRMFGGGDDKPMYGAFGGSRAAG